MYKVELYVRVRRACMVDGMSTREAARVFGLHRDTVRKMLAYSMPPGYRQQTPPRRPKLEPYTGVIDRILEEGHRVSRKQRHTAKRIFERLRDEHGFGGQYTVVKDYVREHRRRTKEMFVPLSHAPGHAQCDFGEARGPHGYRERFPECVCRGVQRDAGQIRGGCTAASLDPEVRATPTYRVVVAGREHPPRNRQHGGAGFLQSVAVGKGGAPRAA